MFCKFALVFLDFSIEKLLFSGKNYLTQRVVLLLMLSDCIVMLIISRLERFKVKFL